MEKTEVISQITIDEYGNIGVRKTKRFVDDDGEVIRTHHRHVIAPDKDDPSHEDERVKKVANLLWTPEVKAKARERRADASKN